MASEDSKPVPTPARSIKPSIAPGMSLQPRRLDMSPEVGTPLGTAPTMNYLGSDGEFGDGVEEESEEEPEDLTSDVPSGSGSKSMTPQVPDVNDLTAARPKPGEIQLSKSAINSRMRRVFTPTLKGKLKVSEQIMQDWQSGPKSKKRQQLEQIFQLCGYDPDFWPI